MEKVKDAIIRSINNNSGVPSIEIPNFALSLSAVIVHLTASILEENAPAMAISRRPVNRETMMDVMGGVDMIRHYRAYVQTAAFLSWFFEQDAPNDEEQAWYYLDYVAKKWNEFQKERLHGKTET